MRDPFQTHKLTTPHKKNPTVTKLSEERISACVRCLTAEDDATLCIFNGVSNACLPCRDAGVVCTTAPHARERARGFLTATRAELGIPRYFKFRDPASKELVDPAALAKYAPYYAPSPEFLPPPALGLVDVITIHFTPKNTDPSAVADSVNLNWDLLDTIYNTGYTGRIEIRNSVTSVSVEAGYDDLFGDPSEAEEHRRMSSSSSGDDDVILVDS